MLRNRDANEERRHVVIRDWRSDTSVERKAMIGNDRSRDLKDNVI